MDIPPPNTLSFTANKLRDLLLHEIDELTKVHIGPPSEALPNAASQDKVVNVFFYRVEPSGFFPDANINDPFFLRIHCLITAFGKQTDLTQGEVNLRLLGSVIRVMHENPVHNWDFTYAFTDPDFDDEDGTLEPSIINTGAVLNVQTIFKPMSTEELNQIWSTQGDTTYRTSIGYELALAPIYPHNVKPETSRVGQAMANVKKSPTTPQELGEREEEEKREGKEIGKNISRQLTFTDSAKLTVTVNGDYDVDRKLFSPESDHVNIEFDADIMPDHSASDEYDILVYKKTKTSFTAYGSPIDVTGAHFSTSVTVPDEPGTYLIIAESRTEGVTKHSNVLTLQVSENFPPKNRKIS